MVRLLLNNNRIKMFAVLICTMNFAFTQCWDGSADNECSPAALGFVTEPGGAQTARLLETQPVVGFVDNPWACQ